MSITSDRGKAWASSIRLVAKAANHSPHIYERDCQAVVDAILGRISDALAAGDRVELRGFGSFLVKERQAREGRNPKTGAKITVSAKGALVFKAGKEMWDRLNPLKAVPLQ